MKTSIQKKQFIVLSLLLITLKLWPQSFNDSGFSLPGAIFSSVAWGDYNLDGYLDFALLGEFSNNESPKIFLNNGGTGFTDTEITLVLSAFAGSVAWSDYDRDGDLDLLVTGHYTSFGGITRLYRNNYPTNSFDEQTTVSLTGAGYGSGVWGDYDNDGNPDILLTGNASGSSISKIYRNYSNNLFVEQKNFSITPMSNGAVAWGDYDNDGNLDFIQTGATGVHPNYNPVSKIYHNNGKNFIEQTGISITGVYNSSVAWGDYDSDGDLDLIISGMTENHQVYTAIYKNNGDNTFTEQTSIQLTGAYYGSVSWGDYDNDGDLDILLTGSTGSSCISKIYTNNYPLNTFSELTDANLTGVAYSSSAWGDYDKDGKLDILLTGSDINSNKVTKIYHNNCSAANTAPATPTGLTAFCTDTSIVVQWNRVEGDETPSTGLSYNLSAGTGTGSGNIVNPMAKFSNGVRLLPGIGNSQAANFYILKYPAKVKHYISVQAIDNGYKASSFAESIKITFPNSLQASTLQADDITGSTINLTWRRGNGTGCMVFAKKGENSTASPANGSPYTPDARFGLGSQIVSTGWFCVYDGTGSSVNISNLEGQTKYTFNVIEYDAVFSYFTQTGYKNPLIQQTSVFTDRSDISFAWDYMYNSVSWSDYDNDGDLDMVIVGGNSTIIYDNNGGAFSNSGITLPGISYGMISWGDYNNDGYADFLFIGNTTKIFLNNKNRTFSDSGISLPSVSNGSGAWYDFDNDGDMDIILNGSTGSGVITKIYKNGGSKSSFSFTEQPGISLPGIPYGSFACSDYNKDGYIDILLTCVDFTKLYRNNGDFTFTEQSGTSFTKVQYSTVSWGDYDNDGFPDLLFTGTTTGSSSGSVSKVYHNNGNNTFTELTGINLPGVQYGSSAWGDYDNDGDLDILITGEFPGTMISKIYRNEGSGNFSERPEIKLQGIKSSSVAWGDYDNDGDLDILMAGQIQGNVAIAKVYRNDLPLHNSPPAAPQGLDVVKEIGSTVLSWNPVTTDETPASGLTYNVNVGTSSGFSQIKSALASLNTGKRVIPSFGNTFGKNSYNIKYLIPGKYYWRVQAIDNGFSGGLFSQEKDFTIDPVQASKLEAKILPSSSTGLTLKWANGNGQRRIVFCKQGSVGGAFAVVQDNETYTSDPIYGYGDQVANTGWYCVYNGRNDSTTVYGLTPGISYTFTVIEYIGTTGSETYYRTNGEGNPGVFSAGLFSEQADLGLRGMSSISAAWGDCDNDKHLDIMMIGNNSALIYINRSDNNFLELSNIGIDPVSSGSAAWGDIDNNGTLDVVISGYSSDPIEYIISRIYKNNGNPAFTNMGVNLPGIVNSSVALGDYDNDGFLDLLMSGFSSSGTITKIFHNNGGTGFEELSGIDLKPVKFSASAWGDYDNDGYLDFILTGAFSSYSFTGPVSAIYHNNGNGTFTEKTDISLVGVMDGSVAWADYDNDGDLDLLLTGRANEGAVAIIYRNNGDNTFTKQTGIDITGVYYSSVAWGDYDNDGRLDILLAGEYYDDVNHYVSRLYHNDGNNSFTEETSVSLTGVTGSSVAWGDYDNDGDLDIILTGGFGTNYTSKVYRNNTIMKAGNFPPDNKPAAPTGIVSTPQPEGIKLSWSPVSGDETPSSSMSYNLRIGTSQGGTNTLSPNSDLNGKRFIASMGNAQLDKFYISKGLPTGQYYWAVQAVDQGYMGGAWSADGTFIVKNIQAFFSTDIVCEGLPTHFTDQSVSSDGIVSWEWDFSDGTTSAVQNPVHTFSSGGSYNIKLKITSTGSATDILEQTVTVKSKPITDFTAPAVCQGTAATIANTTNNNGITVSSWFWDFGDGQTSILQQPAAHGYLGAADYTVVLKALANNGCRDSITKTVTVANYPVAAVTANAPLTFCKGDSVTLSVPYNVDYLYTWKTDGTSITGTDSSKFVAKLTGNYTAVVINSKGNCKTESSVVPVVAQNAPVAPLIQLSGPKTFCQGDSVILSIVNTTGYSYQWKLNGGAVGINSNQYTAKSSGNYTLLVSNSNGCSVSSTNSVDVTVNPLPVVSDINLVGVEKFCKGGKATLSVPANANYSYSWKKGTNDLQLTNSSIDAVESGDYTVTVSLAGCKATTAPRKIEVVEKPARPDIDYGSYVKEMCLGENPLKLSVDNVVSGYSYQWYKNETPVSNANSIEVIETGNYYLEAVVDICPSERALAEIVFKKTLPKPDINAKGPTVWYLSTTSDAKYYNWYCNGTLVQQSDRNVYVAGQKMGTYRVSISDDNSCFVFSNTIEIPSGATGIEDPNPFEGVKIYPNPTTGWFTIEMNNNIFGELVIDIFTQNGSKALNIKFEKTTEHFSSQIDLSGQSKGMYLINLAIDKFKATRKILVE